MRNVSPKTRFHRVEFGRVMAELRPMYPHGTWGAELEKRGFSRTHVAHAIKAATDPEWRVKETERQRVKAARQRANVRDVPHKSDTPPPAPQSASPAASPLPPGVMPGELHEAVRGIKAASDPEWWLKRAEQKRESMKRMRKERKAKVGNVTDICPEPNLGTHTDKSPPPASPLPPGVMPGELHEAVRGLKAASDPEWLAKRNAKHAAQKRAKRAGSNFGAVPKISPPPAPQSASRRRPSQIL